MFRPLELFIGIRYMRAKRNSGFISFISLSSILGIALGITALITVLSVMNGFQEEVRNRILAMTPHVTINRLNKLEDNWRLVLNDIMKEDNRVLGGAPFISGEAMLNSGTSVSGAMVYGLLPIEEQQVSYIGNKIFEGTLDNLQPGEFGIILGQTLAYSLGVKLGDKVLVVTPQYNMTSSIGILPRLKRFNVVGLLRAGMYEYDRGLALINISDAAKLFQYPDGTVNGIRIKLRNLFLAPSFSFDLSNKLPANVFYVSDWTKDHANYFRAVRIEKTAMFLILTLIVAVAAFNIVSMLVMVVTDKQADIAILRTLGATQKFIMLIFIIQGVTIGLAGTTLGLIGGITFANNLAIIITFIEQLFNIRVLSPDIYLISDIPSKVQWSDVCIVGIIAFSLSSLATIYPAWKAARTRPAEALRHE